MEELTPTSSNRRGRLLAVALFLFFLGFMAWTLSEIVIYIFLALVFTILGSPLVRLLTRIKLGKRTLPKSVAAGITLLLILTVVFLFFYFLFPLIIRELRTLLRLDPTALTDSATDWFLKIENFLRENGILLQDEHLVNLLFKRFKEFVASFNYVGFFGGTLQLVGTLFIGIFSVIFMSYFSLKDNTIFFDLVKKIVPRSYHDHYDRILGATKRQLINYFSGVFLEMVIMGILEGTMCYFLGVPHPVLIGFLGGLLNIIPYIGPLIAAILATFISVAGVITISPTTAYISLTVLKVVITFVISKLIDDFLLQPFIYAKSVQAHPLEIFIIILIAGNLAGVLGMIFAVPAYSLVRIIARELFNYRTNA